MGNDDRFKLEPRVSLGRIDFGADIRELLRQGLVAEIINDADMPESLKFRSRTFVFADDPNGELAIIHTDESSSFVEDVHCKVSLIANNKEIIGSTLDDLVGALGQEPDDIEYDVDVLEDGLQTIADFDQYGLSVWIQNGVVVSAFVSKDTDEDEG